MRLLLVLNNSIKFFRFTRDLVFKCMIFFLIFSDITTPMRDYSFRVFNKKIL
jgi:hypothetical protein